MAESDPDSTIDPKYQTMPYLTTGSKAAREAYVKGLDFKIRTEYSSSRVEQAIGMFNLAIQEDSGFAEAYAELSGCHAFLYMNGEKTEERRQKAKAALEQALALGSELPVVRQVNAGFLICVESDVQQGLRVLQDSLELYPDSVEFLTSLGTIRRYQGRLKSAIRLLEQAYRSAANPRTAPVGATIAMRSLAVLAGSIGSTYYGVRDFDSADRWFSTALENAPDSPKAMGRRVLNILAKSVAADSNEPIAEARSILENYLLKNRSGLYPVELILDLYSSTLFPDSDTFFEKIVGRIESTPRRPGGPGAGSRYFWYEALAYKRLGHHDAATELVESAFKEIAPLSKTSLGHLARLGIAHAWRGQESEALAAGEAAVRQEEEMGNHFLAPARRESLALTMVLLGKHDMALKILRNLMKKKVQRSSQHGAPTPRPVLGSPAEATGLPRSTQHRPFIGANHALQYPRPHYRYSAGQGTCFR